MYALSVVEKMYLLDILIPRIIIYIVGKCNRLDKCGYHYTPHQYFTDNPWKRDNPPREGGGVTTLEARYAEEGRLFVRSFT